MVGYYEEKLTELTGEKQTLALASPDRAILYACSVLLYQGMQYIDRAGKQNLVKYSYGDFLDHLGALKGVERNKQTKPATVLARFQLEEVRKSDTELPKGTRVTGEEQLYFETTEQTYIPTGEQYKDVVLTCTTSGSIGNGKEVGTLTTIVDPIPFVNTVMNLTESSGGVDAEDDENMAERVYLAPSGYSVAGPADAYTYWAKTYSQLIEQAKPVTKTAGEVTIYITMQGGELPNKTVLEELEVFFKNKNIKPMTDKIVVSAPDVVTYNIELQYWLSEEDETKKQQIEEAVDEFIAWQSVLERNINPSELIRKVLNAGATRVEVIEPVYQEIEETQLAKVGQKRIAYRGIEDD